MTNLSTNAKKILANMPDNRGFLLMSELADTMSQDEMLRAIAELESAKIAYWAAAGFNHPEHNPFGTGFGVVAMIPREMPT